MKKLIMILVLILTVLVVIACMPKDQADVPTQPGTTITTRPTTLPSTTPPATTLPEPTQRPDGWELMGEERYYVQSGNYVTGWLEVEGKLRYFLEDGRLARGFAEADGNRYLFDEEGVFLTGWQEVGTKRYYLGDDGILFTGWLTLEDQLFYMKEDGAMAKGCVVIEGVNHFFTSTGAPVLVLNPWNFLPEDYVADLVELSSTYATSNNRVDRSCYEALKEMIKACNKASGHRVCVISSYRTLEHQQKLFKKQVDKNLKKGYSQEEAERLAAQVVAVPGTSEHHSGLAVDIIDSCCSWDLDEVQAGLPGQQWLMEHSWEYGFILRYPEGTTDSTGIIYEPWHYRYVGKELAKELHDLGLTLEEYMTMLTEAEQ